MFFSSFGGVFVLLRGVFSVLLGCFFLLFARQRDFCFSSSSRRHTIPKRGIPALATREVHLAGGVERNTK